MGNPVAKYYRELDDDTLLKFWKAGGVIQGKEYPLADCYLHTHTDLGSPHDSILTISEYVDIAAKTGARAIAISDHGTLYGAIPLYKACNDYNAKHEENEHIKCIIGVEFYVVDSFNVAIKKKQTRLHLIAYAKDIQGYHTLCRLVTESNKHITKVGNNEFPCISRNELEKFLAPGTEGHGHVILTSACIGGVVAGMMFSSDQEVLNVEKITNAEKAINNLKDSFNFQQNKLEQLKEQKAILDKLSKKTYTKRLKSLEKSPDPVAQAELEKEMAETEQALKFLPSIRNQIKASQAVLTDLKNNLKSQCKQITEGEILERADAQLKLLEQAKAESSQNIVTSDNVEEEFKKAMLYYQQLAGKENWFIEVQFHGIPQEKRYMHVLAELANELDMPLVAANDAHMGTRDKCVARKIVNALRWEDDSKANTKVVDYEAPSDDEYELYLKTDAELFKWLSMELSEKDAFNAMKNRALIVDNCNVTLVQEKHYPKFIP